MQVALINTNRMRPPVAPIGLDYIAEALHAAGHVVQPLDLCWEENPHSAINHFFKSSEFGLVGMRLRNTDDCAFTSGQSFLSGFVELVKTVRENSDAPIVLGGVGFSVMPEQNYNYNANQRLVEATQQGYRGAFWDILRLCE